MIKTAIFITEQGSRLVKRGHVLQVYKNRENIFMFPLDNVSQLILLGRIEVSSSLLSLLMHLGIDTVFLSRDGRFKGRLSGESSKNIFLKEQQFKKRSDDRFCLSVSRKIILSKIRNCRNFIRKQNPALLSDMQNRILNAIRSVMAVQDLNILRGIEGSFAVLYFSVFSRLLKEKMGFKKRIKHPPNDPVNILLSFGYTLLFNTIFGLVESCGLDPYAGFYHQSSYGHPALVSDIVEPYRAPLIDRLVVNCINHQWITDKDFVKENNILRMEDQAVKKFVELYQKRIFDRLKVDQQHKTIWSILQQDVYQLANYLRGEIQDYQPYIFR